MAADLGSSSAGATPRIVVAAAILDDGRLLAAQRAAPAELRGQWELPGGKVEAGETEVAALVRECAEELNVEVQPLVRLGGDWPLVGPLAATHVLRVWTAELGRGRPTAGPAHLAVRWVTPAELPALAWLPADRPLLPLLAQALFRRAFPSP